MTFTQMKIQKAQYMVWDSKDEAAARSSVSKIRKSGRSHAHKIQAAVAMEQRAKAAGKAGPAAVYRRFINSMKKKTKAKKKK